MPRDNAVVVGDGGLLSWGLAYYLQKVGWQVTVVGREEAREASALHGVVDVHPPRLHNYMTLRNAFWHNWFALLNMTMGTERPPQSIEIERSAWYTPTFYNWAARMPLCTREAKLLEHDVASGKLLQRQATLLSDLVKEKVLPGGAAKGRKGLLAPASPYSDNVTDLFLERLSFGDQRFLLTEMQKAGLKYTVSAVKGRAAADWFPSLFNIKQYIRGAVEYHTNVPDLNSVTAGLREHCLNAEGVTHIPRAVASFATAAAPSTPSGKVVSAVVLDDGAEVPCDVVVLAAGADVSSLLVKAGCMLFPPVYQAAAFAIDVAKDTDNKYGGGRIPERSTILENTLYFAQRGDVTRVGGLVTFEDSWWRPLWTSAATEDRELVKKVLARFQEQLHLFGRISIATKDVTALHVDAVAVTPDGLPLIGKVDPKGRLLSRPSNVFVCAGLGPAGGHQALSAAEMLANMTIDIPSAVPVAPYAPNRFWMSA
eukprot:TRINITY_DN19708_c0_g1_i1.p1 TRINITY_DN19708_c0_g1~~TRINITY_DN19708_c0_g1_i1.p1  ORF type:complete len:483 (+),score=156.86 TRINITY_DN19708_c0_g1_i1:57-1505(+)